MLDMCMNTITVILASRFAGWKTGPVRAAAAGAFGAAAALSLRCLSVSPEGAALFWAPAASVMMILACGESARRRPLRSAMLLLSAFGLLGGVVQALQGALGSLSAAYAAGALCTLAISASAVRAGRAAGDVQRASVVVRIRGIEAEFDAMIDSGNTLRDYLTHRPVVVLPEAARERLKLSGVPLRPIFADTAGGRVMMDCFVPEETLLKSTGGYGAVCAAAAFSPGLCAGARALVPAALLHEAKTGRES